MKRPWIQSIMLQLTETPKLNKDINKVGNYAHTKKQKQQKKKG